jgi:hypothetical protein
VRVWSFLEVEADHLAARRVVVARAKAAVWELALALQAVARVLAAPARLAATQVAEAQAPGAESATQMVAA